MSGGGFLACEQDGSSKVVCNGATYAAESYVDTFSVEFWIYLMVYLALMVFAGIASGLTLGLLSLDMTTLQVMSAGGGTQEKKHASALMPVVKHHHLLLVTLLLSNAVAVEAMPLFLDRISNPYVAVIVSVTAVLFFGEVIPQSVCSRYGTAIGYYAIPLVYVLMGLTFVISFPLSVMLDCILGKEHATFYKRAELGALVDLMADETETGNQDPLTIDEKHIIKGALMMKDKTLKDLDSTPLDKVYMIDIDTSFTPDIATQIMRKGKSRIPLYQGERGNVVGLILAKYLLGFDSGESASFREIYLTRGRPILRAHEHKPLFEMLNEFQEGNSHMALISRAILPLRNRAGASKTDNNVNVVASLTRQPQWFASEAAEDSMGIVTLEDVLEELLQEQIYDEADHMRHMYRSMLLSTRLTRQPFTRSQSTNFANKSYNIPLRNNPRSAAPFNSESKKRGILGRIVSYNPGEMERHQLPPPQPKNSKFKGGDTDSREDEREPLLGSSKKSSRMNSC